MKVYLLWDIEGNDLISIHKTKAGAREALVNYLMDYCPYTADEWEQSAKDFGYNNADELVNEMYKYDDYDEDFSVRIVEEEVRD